MAKTKKGNRASKGAVAIFLSSLLIGIGFGLCFANFGAGLLIGIGLGFLIPVLKQN